MGVVPVRLYEGPASELIQLQNVNGECMYALVNKILQGIIHKAMAGYAAAAVKRRR